VTADGPWTSDPRLFAEVARSKDGGPIYIIGGPHEPRVTIYSQQCRAINLVCALYDRDPSLTNKHVAVIGAGAAGMTAASALRAIGHPRSRLTIYERAASPLYAQLASYGRFLHPRLFHWPEAGWRDGSADLPVAGWSAAYAAAVRDQILSHCADLPIEFCTSVSDVQDDCPGARVSLNRLHDSRSEVAHFDVVLVATGFPVERRVDHTLGGTYWHGIDGIDDLRGEVHLVGDGDGALTEVLMMLVDRFGHAVVERLCELLPLGRVDNLDAADLRAQGNPSAKADVRREDAESSLIKAIFELLSYRRSVVIHSTNPLSGKSFLLNRALVSHLVWDPGATVELAGGSRVQPGEVQSLAGSVIWRAGVGFAETPRWARGRLTPANSIERPKPDDPDTDVDGELLDGLLIGLLDGLRRPAWTPSADGRMRSGVRHTMGWIEPVVGPMEAVDGRPTPDAEDLLRCLAATKSALERLGLGKLLLVNYEGITWVSIDALARTGSLPHRDLVEPISPTQARQRRLRAIATGEPLPSTVNLRRDDHQRLWFELPHHAKGAEPTRSAVCAIVDPASVAQWARDRSVARVRAERQDTRRSELRVNVSILRGLSDVAKTDVQAQLRLAYVHEQRKEWDRARDAYLRAARRPGGRHHRTARPEDTSPVVMNEMFRRVVLRLAGATAELLPRELDGKDHAIWLLLSVAAADLVTLADRENPIVELQTTPSFLIREWAPRVRSLLTIPRTRTVSLDSAPPPAWALRLAKAGIQLRPPSRHGSWSKTHTDTRDYELRAIRELATEAARQVYAETPREALITLAELGVWPAGTGREPGSIGG
jgi:hypothetical protein